MSQRSTSLHSLHTPLLSQRPARARTRERHLSWHTLALALLLANTSPGSHAFVIPPARWGHVSVLCGNQLYIHGGHTGVNQLTAPIGSDLYSLDISVGFNSFSTPWTALTPGPYASFHSAVPIGPGNNLLAIFGGNTSFSSGTTLETNSLHLYDTKAGTWAASPLQDPPRREQHTAAARLGDGTMYLLGGMILSTDLLTESPTAEFWRLGGYRVPATAPTANSTTNGSGNGTDPNSTVPSLSESSSAPATPTTSVLPEGLSPQAAGWQKISKESGAPFLDRAFHTATMIRSNGLIVVIGGVSKGSLVPMSEIWVFDTNSGVWSVQTATGATPPLRRSHVAAATSTGRIYIHGGTDLEGSNYFADVAILDTTSWSWNQPPIEGSAPTGRYSHAAAMVGTNMVVTFGLTAGGATNTIFILDTTSNTWVPSYVPNNIAQTSTNPEDWPGYKPPPNIPGIPPPKETTPDTPHHSGSISPVVPIIGGIVGAVALAALVVILVRRRRRYNHKRWIERQRQLSAALYGLESDEPHMNRGAAFMSRGSRIVEPAPSSFGQRVDQLRDSLSGIAFWKRDRRAVNRSQSHRLPDRDDDLEGRRDYDTDPPYPTDQEIFMDAVHRARSRTGVLSPNFSPLQLPLGEARSPRISVTSIGGSSSGGMTRIGEEEEEPHGRAYSDGFENVMLEMDVQMVSVPRGRLYVVNPSDEALDQGPGDVDLADEAYRQFDSQRPRQDP